MNAIEVHLYSSGNKDEPICSLVIAHNGEDLGSCSLVNIGIVSALDIGDSLVIELNFKADLHSYVAIDNLVVSTNRIPVDRGLEIAQTGDKLHWSIDNEVGVKKYEIVDSMTGEHLETFIATRSKHYDTTVQKDVAVKLIIVNNQGAYQVCYPKTRNIY